MALIVQKYGGTSVGSMEKIRNVAVRIARTRTEGNKLVVVLSAMAGETDRLLGLAAEAAAKPIERELDVLLATGEQVSIALMTIVLNEMGVPAISLLAHQVKIQTDDKFCRARIKAIDPEAALRQLEDGKVVIVAGFQGVDEGGDITTLGRGGSDTTAVALAAALNADECEIYTDVDGVFTTDPNICPKARKLERISYDEMLEMSSQGAKVLQIRSVAFAKRYNVPLRVRSSFNDDPGTLVTKEEPGMESMLVTGIAYNRKEALLTIIGVPDKPSVASDVFQPISGADINVDMIIKNRSVEGFSDFSFTVPKLDEDRAFKILSKQAEAMQAVGVDRGPAVAKISIIGVGMKDHSGIASKTFKTLAGEGIGVMLVSTSEIKVSVLIEDKYAELAVRALHDAFDLDKECVTEEVF
ncbi:MAG: aspartate kinase [Candidatus Alcyoniella australis]|nr:aspartate kinase [Candidatus Alcyoniella australis]